MAEATSSIAQSPTVRVTTASHVLAMLRARNAIKAELRKFGVKVSHLAAREITSWALVYLDDHRDDLMPDAIATVERWLRGGVLGKRAQKEFIKHLRAAELVDLRWEQIDFTSATLHVRRIKHGTPATHPLTGRSRMDLA